MRAVILGAAALLAGGCGNILGLGDVHAQQGSTDGPGHGDAPRADARIDGPMIDADLTDAGPLTFTVSGTALIFDGTSYTPASGFTIDLLAPDGTTELARGTTNGGGGFSETATAVPPFDGFLEVEQMAPYKAVYRYPSHPFTGDTPGISITVVSSTTYNSLATLCGYTPANNEGVVGVVVQDAIGNGVSGQTVTMTPAPKKLCYIGSGGTPDTSLGMTTASGIAYGIGVATGAVTVAAAPGTVMTRVVHAHANATTEVSLQP